MDEPTLREFYNEAVRTLEQRNAEIERLRAVLEDIADADPLEDGAEELSAVARAALSHQQAEDKCKACGFPRKEHSYNGACYGLCGEFQ